MAPDKTADSEELELNSKVHGRVKVRLQSNNIIHYEAIGPFNEEFIEAVSLLDKDIIEKLVSENRNWAVLIEFKESCLATSDALVSHADHLKRCVEKGRIQKATALVINNDVTGAILAPSIFNSNFEASQAPLNIFDNMTEANQWLTEILNDSI